MFKKIISIVIILTLMFILAIPAMAYPDYEGPVFGNSVNNKITENSSEASEVAEEESEEDLFEKLLAEVIRNPNIKETEQFLAKVGIINNNTVDIMGQLNATAEEETEKSEDEEVWGILAVYNEEKNIYEEYAGESGESRWIIGDSGIFSDSFRFEKGGEYKLKIIIFIKPLLELSTEDLIINLNYLNNLGLKESSEGGPEDKEVNNTPKIDSTKIVLELDKNLQINYFTVNMLDENTKEKLVKSESNFNLESILRKIFQTK